MVGIVILNYNTAIETIRCIQSIEKYVQEEYKIYVVDNASDEKDITILKHERQSHQNIKLICLPKNLGYSGGNNEGIDAALKDGASELLIVNSDVIFKNDIVTILKRDIKKSVVLAAPRVINENGENGQLIRKNFEFKYALTNKKPLYYIGKIIPTLDINYKIKNWNEKKVFFGSPSGCCFMISSDSMKKMQCFDANVFLYCEEYIIGKKMKNMNKKSCYDPDAIVVHYEGIASQKKSNGFLDFHNYLSEYYLLHKYCDINAVQRIIIRVLREINFMIKAIVSSSHRQYLKKFLYTIRQINRGIYKLWE